MELDPYAAVGVRDPYAAAPRQVPIDEAAHAVHLTRRVGCVAREDLGRDRGVAFHHTECKTSSVASGRAKNLNGTNVVPSPGETCIVVPPRS